jgi:hypothetical protein
MKKIRFGAAKIKLPVQNIAPIATFSEAAYSIFISTSD